MNFRKFWISITTNEYFFFFNFFKYGVDFIVNVYTKPLIEDEEPMKKCTKCGQWKLVSEFYKQKNGKYGVQSRCKECEKEYNKKYYENNKEHKKEYSREYYENNKDKYKNYYENNKDDIKESYKHGNKYKRLSIIKSLNRHKQKYDVIVTVDECMEMDNEYCFYCGCKLEWEYGTGFTNCSPTIDRLNNENTLTKDNIVFACRSCNIGKNNGTLEEYIERCKRVAANEHNILGR